VLWLEFGSGGGKSENCVGEALKSLVVAFYFLASVVLGIHLGVVAFPLEVCFLVFPLKGVAPTFCVGSADFPLEDLALFPLGLFFGIVTFSTEGVALCARIADVPLEGFALTLGFETMSCT
jgi:hypothetical protein